MKMTPSGRCGRGPPGTARPRRDPNVGARLQGIAAPNTLVISAATFQLLGGFFACQPLGTPFLKGMAQPLVDYRVLYESMARTRLEAVGSTGLTPMVGREQEVGLLLQRWALRFDQEESHQQKLNKLEGFLVQYGLPLVEAVPLFASLLSLRLPATYVPP